MKKIAKSIEFYYMEERINKNTESYRVAFKASGSPICFLLQKKKKLNRVFKQTARFRFLFNEGENIRSHVLGGNEREELVEGK